MILKVDEDLCTPPLFSPGETALFRTMLHHAADLAVRNFPDCFLLQNAETEWFSVCSETGNPLSLLASRHFSDDFLLLPAGTSSHPIRRLGDCLALSKDLLLSYQQARERLSGWLLSGRSVYSDPPDAGCQRLMCRISEIASLTTASSKSRSDSESLFSLANALIQDLPIPRKPSFAVRFVIATSYALGIPNNSGPPAYPCCS